MAQKIKKLFFHLLTNEFTGRIISALFRKEIPDLRWPSYKFLVKRDGVDKKIAASLFFGFYEAGEIRFIHKYFNGDSDVVELGGSMGIVSGHIASLLKAGKKLITVEANPFLVDTLQYNISKYSAGKGEFVILNNAIAYHAHEVALQLTGNSTETKAVNLTNNGEPGKVIVKAIKLSEIIANYALNDFTLVSDIEGAEAELLALETEGLKNCHEMFIELHDSIGPDGQVTVDSLARLIQEKHHFKLIDRNGPVLYFSRK